MARPATVPLGFSTRSLRFSAGVSVLVVDDVHATRAGLAELLRLRGLTVYEAANGHEALEVLRAHPEACVVVLDLMMPQDRRLLVSRTATAGPGDFRCFP
jgi:CheY-like chemotaxis protein